MLYIATTPTLSFSAFWYKIPHEEMFLATSEGQCTKAYVQNQMQVLEESEVII